MTTNSEKLENFTNELKNHPKLLEHFSHIVAMVKSETCPTHDLNDFEEQVIDELRGFGKDIIEEWALKQSDSHAENMINSGFKLEYKGKKKSVFIPPSGTYTHLT
jgi:uncharacterized NAD(P)/FAD-binding protein YdhS